MHRQSLSRRASGNVLCSSPQNFGQKMLNAKIQDCADELNVNVSLQFDESEQKFQFVFPSSSQISLSLFCKNPNCLCEWVIFIPTSSTKIQLPGRFEMFRPPTWLTPSRNARPCVSTPASFFALWISSVPTLLAELWIFTWLLCFPGWAASWSWIGAARTCLPR